MIKAALKRVPSRALSLLLPFVAMPIVGCADAEIEEEGEVASVEQANTFTSTCPHTCSSSQMIIGCDDREPIGPSIDSAKTAPWSFTGSFDGTVGCTGTLVGDRFVLTAAHCMAGKANSKVGFALAQEFEAFSGRPFGTHGVRRVHVPAEFAGNNTETDRALDYAVAELWSPIPGATPAKFKYINWSTLQDMPARSVGYPGTPPDDGVFGRPFATGGKAWQATQPFAWLGGGESGLLYSALDGTGGQSGSPVYVIEPDGNRTVTGVMIGSPVAACEKGQNWVARLTPGAVEHIENLMKPNVLDFFWKTTNFAPSPDAGPGKSWP